MSTSPQHLHITLATLLLLLAFAAPATANTYVYQGQLQTKGSGKVCEKVSGGTFDINIYGRDNGPQRFDGYLTVIRSSARISPAMIWAGSV